MFKCITKPFLVFLTFGLIGVSILSPQNAWAQGAQDEPEQYVVTRLLADKTNNIQAGESICIGLEQIIYPKWHTYWKNPGDSGLATSITWDLPEGFSVGELEWPTPQKIPFGPLTNYGYEGTVTLLQTLTVPDNLSDMPYQLDARVDLLVCHDICIPESYDVSIILNGTTPAEPDKIAAAEELLPITQDVNAGFYANGENLVLDITGDFINADSVKSITILPEEWGLVKNTADAKIKKTDTGFSISQNIGERDFAEIEKYNVIVNANKNDGTTEIFRISAVEIENPTLNSITNENNAGGIGLFLQAFIFALLGGIVLNLMPCVFPVLSMKALSLVNLHKEEESKARAHGIAYTLGILISFAIIGGILLALKAGGAQIGWGFQLQSPVIIMALAYLVFIIGLNLAGFFEFTNKLSNIGQKQTQGDGTKGAFFTGVLATLVATPCTAPFMGVALGYALTQPAIIAMSVFLALGFGLALPYLALCFIPALRSKLPRPGAWMDTFKQFLSFPLFLTAVWLIWVLARQGGEMAVLIALLGMVTIAFILWLGRHIPKSGIAKTIAVAALIISIFFTVSTFITVGQLGVVDSVAESGETQNWESFSNEKLSSLLKGDQPIFTNMTAAWCITCQVNDRIALKPNSTKTLFKDLDVAYLKGDWTNKDAQITKYLNQYDRQGVPLYVYYGARDPMTGKRPEAVVLPQILTTRIVKNIVTK